MMFKRNLWYHNEKAKGKARYLPVELLEVELVQEAPNFRYPVKTPTEVGVFPSTLVEDFLGLQV